MFHQEEYQKAYSLFSKTLYPKGIVEVYRNLLQLLLHQNAEIQSAQKDILTLESSLEKLTEVIKFEVKKYLLEIFLTPKVFLEVLEDMEFGLNQLIKRFHFSNVAEERYGKSVDLFHLVQAEIYILKMFELMSVKNVLNAQVIQKMYASQGKKVLDDIAVFLDIAGYDEKNISKTKNGTLYYDILEAKLQAEFYFKEIIAKIEAIEKTTQIDEDWQVY